MAHGPNCARNFNSMRTHSPRNLAIRAIRKLRPKSRTGTGLLFSMFEKDGLLFFHFYYPPAGQSGEYFRWKNLMCVFVQPCTTNEHKAAIRECGQGAPKVQPGVQRVGPVCQLDSENNWPVRPLMQVDNTDLRPMCYMAALGRHFTFNCCCQGGC